jgi:hypothetical protein
MKSEEVITISKDEDETMIFQSHTTTAKRCVLAGRTKAIPCLGWMLAALMLINVEELAADLQSLQVARKQLEIQLASEQELHANAQRAVDQITQELKDLNAKRKQRKDPLRRDKLKKEQEVANWKLNSYATKVASLKEKIANLNMQIVALSPSSATLASLPMAAGDVREISPKSERGLSLGVMKAGMVLRLQYVSGTWKAWGHNATASPDDPNEHERGDKNRLAIVNILTSGAVEPLVVVPTGTVTNPFEFTAPRDLENVALRINSDGNWASNPNGHVKYRVTVGEK